MSALDWLVFVVTLAGIILYGMWRGRGQHDADGYLRAGRSMPWYVVLLGVMATQASAITFLSAPGQAFTDGMRFVQYYFGLPLAMIVISVTFIPLFRKANVYTAYEFLERRFDRKTRVLTSILFLVSRGLSTGISIYAPSIIVSSIIGLNIYLTNILVGGMLLLYTLRGGARSVAHTQTLMFGIILAAMVVAGAHVVYDMPGEMTFGNALQLADAAGKMNIITTNVDLHDRYNLLSGIIGGFFLALSYFGTDQSQVGRILTGKDVRSIRIGLLMNGLIKVPMQFGILLIGALLVALYSVLPAPIFFNDTIERQMRERAPQQTLVMERRWTEANDALRIAAADVTKDVAGARERYAAATSTIADLRTEYRSMVHAQGFLEHNDTNYIFLHYVRTMLPAGLVGLLFAVVILASWGSISAGFHSLATASAVDVHAFVKGHGETIAPSVDLARWHTLGWGVFGIIISMAATQMGSLIEAVNVLGSLFYGPILGIFLVAFYVKRTQGSLVFWAGIIAEIVVAACWWFDVVSFLWLNVIGALVVTLIAWVGSIVSPRPLEE
jgi:solute:Na+ symporter, SSS family